MSIAISQTLSRNTKESRFIENECKQKKQLSTHWEHSHAVTYQSASNRHRRKYSPCFDTLSSRENLSYSKINANKLVGDLFSYDEFKTAFDTILGGAGIESYSLSRFDMRFDSFDPEHYRDYAKLNRYLISALAVTYNVQNCYDSRNLFSQKQLSVAIKNKRFECENYDKEAESGGRDPAYARLELRSKCLTSNDIEKQFHGWYIRLDKALKNLDKVHQRYNDELEKIYKEEKDAFPVKFRSLTDFLIQYQNCIFCKAQMIDLLSRFDEVKNPETRAKNHKKRYGIEYFSKMDVEYAVAEIKRAAEKFFEGTEMNLFEKVEPPLLINIASKTND